MKINRVSHRSSAVTIFLGLLGGGAIGLTYKPSAEWMLFSAIVGGVLASLVVIGTNYAFNLTTKPETYSLTPIVAKVSIVIIGLGELIVLGLSVFTSQLDLTYGWFLVLLGTGGVAINAIANSAKLGKRRINGIGAAFLVPYGLALITKSSILSAFFIVTTILAGLFMLRDIFKTAFPEHSNDELE